MCSVALTLCNPMDCSPPGSSVHAIFQERILEQVAISYSRGSSQLRDRTVSPMPLALAVEFFTTSARGAWWAAVHGVSKSWTRLSDFTFTFHFHALEKEMAAHSSVLAWRIPGMAEHGELPSMGSHRVGLD